LFRKGAKKQLPRNGKTRESDRMHREAENGCAFRKAVTNALKPSVTACASAREWSHSPGNADIAFYDELTNAAQGWLIEARKREPYGALHK
jgi:hypothetical protein